MCVIQQTLCSGWSSTLPKYEKTGRGRSPRCFFNSKLIVFPSSRGGVPVFSRLTGRASSRRLLAKDTDAGSLPYPPDMRCFQREFVRTGRFQRSSRSPCLRWKCQSRLSLHMLPCNLISLTGCWSKAKFSCSSNIFLIADLYKTLSACTRVARTAGPLLRFKTRN